MGFTYQVECLGTIYGKAIANIYHVWDGDESETPDDVADVFENSHLPDVITYQSNQLVWNRINVIPLDVGNLLNAISRVISLTGADAGEVAATGIHAWVKFISDDNGFKSGGKLFAGLTETKTALSQISSVAIAAMQVFYDDFLTDLTTAGLSCCIYRPTLSTPGFPSISICSAIAVRGIGTNNRRQLTFQK